MTNLKERLRDADANSVQRANGSHIFGEAADRIEVLERALEQAADWFNEYAESHADKMLAAKPGTTEHASREDKSLRNMERRDFLRQALGQKP